MKILGFLIIVAMLLYTFDNRRRIKALETVAAYGTYPSDVFPDDPRHNPHWYDVFLP